MQGEGPIFWINGRFGSPEKKIRNIIISKAITKFCSSSYYNTDNSYLFVTGKEIFKFKANNKNVNFLTQFCLGSISNRFSAAESREVSFKWECVWFSVDYNALINLPYLTFINI